MSPAGRGRRRWPRSAVAAVLGLVALLVVVALATDGDGSDAAGPSTTTTPSPPSSATGSTAATSPDPGDASASTTAVAAPSTTSSTAPGATTTAPAPVVPVELPDLPAAGLVDRLVVAAPATDPPYVRDRFDGGGWAYDPSTGCNVREEVLIEESLVAPTVDDRCRSTGGRWRSAYDGVETTEVADLEIDHLVPLADAWRSGAWAWTPEQRLAFANDRTSPDTLIAVTSATNRSKGDSPPDAWLPPDRTAWCGYASAWVRVKARWALTVTAAERDALVRVLAAC